ncbi:urea ABC transporter ATP-binding protein UrtD [Polynucleobacter rarus]|uniref:urea ABC transporter ATP-binding protein UrtD n=1 Tax=Polynucleobacter rarus TaxID=556055 RepID=UPI000D3E12A4|nr:urea ABC transporter ATP-binding protein UrtD [Polynucleobacter rarus]
MQTSQLTTSEEKVDFQPEWESKGNSGHFLEKGKIDLSHGEILYIEDLVVSFDGFKAIKGLTLDILSGELRCIIGPNGAGKTTMMDVITGKTGPRNAQVSGRVFLGQTIDLLKLKEPQIAQIGIGRKFQKPTVFENLKVWENLELARKSNKSWRVALNAKVDQNAIKDIELTLLQIGLESEAYIPAGALSHGQKQRLEIGMLLMQKPELLLLDEPAAGMTDEETMQLADLLNQLRGSCSIVVVEHDMEFVSALSGQTGIVTVLAEGAVLAQGTMDQVKNDPAVIESYLGR